MLFKSGGCQRVALPATSMSKPLSRQKREVLFLRGISKHLFGIIRLSRHCIPGFSEHLLFSRINPDLFTIVVLENSK
jgi:hypothetical protein